MWQNKTCCESCWRRNKSWNLLSSEGRSPSGGKGTRIFSLRTGSSRKSSSWVRVRVWTLSHPYRRGLEMESKQHQSGLWSGDGEMKGVLTSPPSITSSWCSPLTSTLLSLHHTYNFPSSRTSSSFPCCNEAPPLRPSSVRGGNDWSGSSSWRLNTLSARWGAPPSWQEGCAASSVWGFHRHILKLRCFCSFCAGGGADAAPSLPGSLVELAALHQVIQVRTNASNWLDCQNIFFKYYTTLYVIWFWLELQRLLKEEKKKPFQSGNVQVIRSVLGNGIKHLFFSDGKLHFLIKDDDDTSLQWEDAAAYLKKPNLSSTFL